MKIIMCEEYNVDDNVSCTKNATIFLVFKNTKIWFKDQFKLKAFCNHHFQMAFENPEDIEECKLYKQEFEIFELIGENKFRKLRIMI